MLDVGCATGDFLWFLRTNYDNLNLFGVDVDNELLMRAKTEVPEAIFINADIISDDFGDGYDFIFMNGVHSIFNAGEPFLWINPLIKAVKKSKKSKVYVFGLFNDENLDVNIQSRGSSAIDDDWEVGWNITSKKTVSDYCDSVGYKCTFHDFNIQIDISKNSDDPLRSWTIPTKKGCRIIVNGLQLVHTFSLMELSLR